MTEEEFKALLKVRGDGLKLEVISETIWTVMLSDESGATTMDWWASSDNKEMALETLANKYFKGEDADPK